MAVAGPGEPVYTGSFMQHSVQRLEPVAAPNPILESFDPAAPMKEAAMFYGLFLRGHSVEALRRDIDVPKSTLEKWLRPRRYEPDFQDTLRRIYQFRKQVLAIFDELVLNERNRARPQ
jgi:hypothetical protein